MSSGAGWFPWDRARWRTDIAACRWAIIGTGEVAAKFAVGLRSAPGAVVALVASRSADRGAAFAAQLRIGRAVVGYEAAAAAADVDVVYVATPPSEHRANALMFLAAGKPVLIEKPFAASAADAEAIFAAARSAGVFCMEGLWTRFLPALELARALIGQGRIGAPRALFASFAAPEIVDASRSLFSPTLGGGALAHRGVYPISLALDLLGPARLSSAAVTRGDTGVDEDAVALLRHDSGAVSTVYAGARTSADNGLVIHGTEGTLRFAGPIYRPFGVEIESVRPRRKPDRRWSRADILKEGPLAQGLRQRLGRLPGLARLPRVIRAPYIGNGYAHEAIAVMKTLAEGGAEHPLMTQAATLATLRLIEQIKATGETGERLR